jgi:hypothetical protein
LNRADWPALSRKSARPRRAGVEGREAAAEVAAVLAQALLAVEVVEAAEFGEAGALGGDAGGGLFAGNGELADDEDEAVAVEVAAAELVAVGVRRAEGDGRVGELGEGRAGRERHGDPLLGDRDVVLEAGEADLRAGDAGLAAELEDRVLAADAALGQREQEMGADAAVRGVGGDLTDDEVLRAHPDAAADAGQVGRLQRRREQVGGELVEVGAVGGPSWPGPSPEAGAVINRFPCLGAWALGVWSRLGSLAGSSGVSFLGRGGATGRGGLRSGRLRFGSAGPNSCRCT